MTDPLFILAPPRSFTSIVCAMLGQHPQMYGLPETNLLVAETMRERRGVISDRAASEHGLLRVVAQLWSGEQTAHAVAFARHWIESRLDSECVSVLRELGEKVHPRILVDKSPMTALRAEYMQRARRAFPQARFLHLLRHPRTQCESVLRSGGSLAAPPLGAAANGPSSPSEDPQKAWYTFQMNIATFLDGLPNERKLRVRAEDLLVDPDAYLAQIAEWLGVRADTQAIEEMKHPERSPYAAFGPVTARFGFDSKFLRAPKLRVHTRGIGPTLRGPLGWRRDGAGFSPEVIRLATEFGYQ
jgi:sulfotransferase family protein